MDDNTKKDLKFLGAMDKIRAVIHLFAETLDVLRIPPRLFMGLYIWMFYDVYQWYKVLEAPTTQQAALMTTVVGFAGVLFGFYSKTGHSWKEGFKSWKTNYLRTRGILKKEEPKKEVLAEQQDSAPDLSDFD